MRARSLLLLVAAALGITTGVAAAFVVPEVIGEQPEAGVGAETEPVEDPLDLGIPLENLDCTRESILILKSGDGSPALASAVANHRSELDLKYLRPEESCDTLWIDPRHETPEYVVYAGPFDDWQAPCKLRLTAEHKRNMVLRLREDVSMFVKCLCVLPVSEFPELYLGMDETAETSIYTWQLQNILMRYDKARREEGIENPSGEYFLGSRPMTGRMDEQTEQRVRDLQDDGDMPITGRVDTATWRTAVAVGCKHFDF